MSITSLSFIESLTSPETELDETIRNNPKIQIVAIKSPSAFYQTSNKLLFLAVAPLKVFLQVVSLWQTLAYRTRPAEWLLVQNPPSIPTLLLAVSVCFLRGTKLIIDWHNFGYTILGLKLGGQHPLVRISYAYEFFVGKFAAYHLTVTDAMGRILRQRFGPEADIRTLHDRPAEIFQPMNERARFAFLQTYTRLCGHFNAIADGKAFLLVSSTSWTPDEDFSIFLEALCQYCLWATTDLPHLPDIVVVITGKGPQKQRYERLIEKLTSQGLLSKAHIYTDWLSFRDYAQLLAAADLGVSLHTSSSGVDLPMKVVDMFGAGLPVLGWSKFAAWEELVTEGINGRGFDSADQMAIAIRSLLSSPRTSLERLKQGAVGESKRRWKDEWDPVMGKLLGVVD